MHHEVERTFRDALIRSIPVIRELLPRCSEPYLIWIRNPPTQNSRGWSGHNDMLPNWNRLKLSATGKLGDISEEFTNAIRQYHPELLQPFSIGRTTRLHTWGSQEDIILEAIRVLFDKHNTLEFHQGEIDAIVDEFAEFIDAASVKIRYSAQLINLSMDCDQIELGNGVTIQHLTEKEISSIHGGFQGRQYSRSPGIHECALICVIDEPKFLGEQAATQARRNLTVSEKFDKALVALRTFKSGHVGYERISGSSIKFCPLDISGQGHSDFFVPLGDYRILTTEVESLQKHTAVIFSIDEPAMEMACLRLAEAETRLRAEDRIIDAVIGLEALLLASQDPDQRGELRFRFALHYSTFGSSPEERYEYFRVAKGLYDLRSLIAHGGRPKASGFKIGQVKLQLQEAAQCGCEVLRNVIQYFSKDASRTTYKNHGYWERKYFGLEESV